MRTQGSLSTARASTVAGPAGAKIGARDAYLQEEGQPGDRAVLLCAGRTGRSGVPIVGTAVPYGSGNAARTVRWPGSRYC
jgi:hypothetical protein